jgi:hypothetical protein
MLSRWYLDRLFFHLKMDAIYSFETSVDFHRTTWRYIPEDSTLHNNGCENLGSYKARNLLSNVYETEVGHEGPMHGVWQVAEAQC